MAKTARRSVAPDPPSSQPTSSTSSPTFIEHQQATPSIIHLTSTTDPTTYTSSSSSSGFSSSLSSSSSRSSSNSLGLSPELAIPSLSQLYDGDVHQFHGPSASDLIYSAHQQSSSSKYSIPASSSISSSSSNVGKIYQTYSLTKHENVINNSNNSSAVTSTVSPQPSPAPPPSQPSPPPPPPLVPQFNQSTILTNNLANDRERVRMEFFATYDVMTGVRIAATLGGFFGLMVFLVIYKSRGESHETLRALNDPKIAAVAAAVMQEEEDRELAEAMAATGMSIYPDDFEVNLGYRRQRMMSIGNVSAPPVLNRGFRFSSIGGYSSLSETAQSRRFSYTGGRRRSTSETSRILGGYTMGGSFGIDDYFLETDGDEADDEFDQLTLTTATDYGKPYSSCLSVPPKGQESRRSSSITCCSSESSFLERRCSAITLGLSSIPPITSINPSRRTSSIDYGDYYYPDIQIINPTPKTSPCPSDKYIYDKQKYEYSRNQKQYRNPSSHYYNQQQSQSYTQPSYKCISEYPDDDDDDAYDEDEDGDGVDGDNVNDDDEDDFVILNVNDKIKKKSHLINGNHLQQHPQQHPIHDHYNDINNVENINDIDENDEDMNNETYFISNPQHVSTKDHYVKQLMDNSNLDNTLSGQNVSRRAPLASLSSLKISSIDYQDSDLRSLGSDSVFVDSYIDTDDEMDQFSTDTDEISDEQKQPDQPQQQPQQISNQTTRSINRNNTYEELNPSNSSHNNNNNNNNNSNNKNTTYSCVNELKSNRNNINNNSNTISNQSNERLIAINNKLSHKSKQNNLGKTFQTKAIIEKSHHIAECSSSAKDNNNELPVTDPSLVSTSKLNTTMKTINNNNNNNNKRTLADDVEISSSGEFNDHNNLIEPSENIHNNDNNNTNTNTNINNNNIYNTNNNNNNNNNSENNNNNNNNTNINNSNNNNNNSNKSDDTKVNLSNVIIDNNNSRSVVIVNPSVILELPVISAQEHNNDPSLPRTSRKWSKETLF